MNLTLGGPGVPCSALRVRRLEAGELSGDERARTLAHVAECARCRATSAELAEERARLEASLPFEELAAGVAERLARAEAPRRAPPRARRFLPLALAAGLAAAAALPLVLDVAGEERGFRLKGAAAVTLHVRHEATVRALAPGEPVPAGAALRVELAPGDHRHAAIVLLDGDGEAVLYDGPAAKGLLPGAFEWTGPGPGRLVAVLDDAPVDAAALLARLRAGGVRAAAPGPDAEVLVVALARGGP
jgi:hypothetical protein